MTDTQPFVEDIAKYTDNVKEEVVEALVANLASVINNKDAMLVGCTDPSERETVKTNFVEKKLGISDDAAAQEAVEAVCSQMKEDRTKSRVTFYYLLAEKLDAFSAIV
jgi:hypothetical protein